MWNLKDLYWPQDKLIALHDTAKQMSLNLYKLIQVGYTICWSRMEYHSRDKIKIYVTKEGMTKSTEIVFHSFTRILKDEYSEIPIYAPLECLF